jgi:hypothetical protein
MLLEVPGFVQVTKLVLKLLGDSVGCSISFNKYRYIYLLNPKYIEFSTEIHTGILQKCHFSVI